MQRSRWISSFVPKANVKVWRMETSCRVYAPSKTDTLNFKYKHCPRRCHRLLVCCFTLRSRGIRKEIQETGTWVAILNMWCRLFAINADFGLRDASLSHLAYTHKTKMANLVITQTGNTWWNFYITGFIERHVYLVYIDRKVFWPGCHRLVGDVEELDM